MYKPLFNKVLVEIDDKDAKWGKSSDGSFAGESYREGMVFLIGDFVATKDYPNISGAHTVLNQAMGKQVMWHEGHESGTVFEENGKKYALIFWWDIIGVKE